MNNNNMTDDNMNNDIVTNVKYTPEELAELYADAEWGERQRQRALKGSYRRTLKRNYLYSDNEVIPVPEGWDED